MFLWLELLLVAIAVIGVALFLSSGLKHLDTLTVVSIVSALTWAISPLLPGWTPTPLFKVVLPLLASPPLAYALLVLQLPPVNRRYFSLITIGETPIPAWRSGFMLHTRNPIGERYFHLLELSNWCLIALIAVHSASRAASTGFGRVSLDLRGLILILLLSSLAIFSVLCRKADFRSHSKVFKITGTVAVLMWVGWLATDPVLKGSPLSVDGFLTSVKGKAGFFPCLGAFFLGNYGKLDLLESEAVHRKAFWVWSGLFALTLSTAAQEMERYLEKLPLSGMIPKASASALLAYPVMLGSVLKRPADQAGGRRKRPDGSLFSRGKR